MKARNKRTGEIVEYVVDNRLITHCVGSHVYTKEDFNTLYEVIDDTPIEKGWEERAVDLFGLDIERCGTDTNGNLISISEFIAQVEQQAYAKAAQDKKFIAQAIEQLASNKE